MPFNTFLPDNPSYEQTYYYCKNCGHKRYSGYLSVIIPAISLVEDGHSFIPDDSMIKRNPLPPKWVRPAACFVHLVEDFNIPWTRQDRREFEKEDEDYENRIKKGYQKWKTWKNNYLDDTSKLNTEVPINLTETLEKNFGLTKQELEYCLRRYQ